VNYYAISLLISVDSRLVIS